MKWILTYWAPRGIFSDRWSTANMRSFKSKEDALRAAMRLGPHVRMALDTVADETSELVR